jgi:hypothetical protein
MFKVGYTSKYRGCHRAIEKQRFEPFAFKTITNAKIKWVFMQRATARRGVACTVYTMSL